MAEYELRPGQMVGEYRVERLLGEGGFGKVYAAVHPVIGKAAAVKILNPQLARSPEIVSRFVDEARAVNQIRHRNIIDIFAFGTLPGGLHYFVMEMLEGMPLDAYLEKHAPLDPGHALSLLWPVGRALVAAHKAGIAHRDLKPENVFLTMDEDGAIFPKLLDFGIAKLLHEGEMAHRTRTGAMMGTPYYMSPEQCRGVGVDHRSDIYSFGIMVHQVLTGRHPFSADNIMDLLMKQISEPAPRMSSMRPDLPQALDAPVLRMLEKASASRPQTMQAALDELAAAARSAGIELANTAQASMLPPTPRPSTPRPAQVTEKATSAPHLDTAAWLQRSAGAAVTGPSGQTPAQSAQSPYGPGATEVRGRPPTAAPSGPHAGAGQYTAPPAGPHQTPGPGQYATPGAGQYPTPGPGQYAPAGPGPHAISAAPQYAPREPQKGGSAFGIVAAIGGGLALLFVLAFFALVVIGIAASGVELRAGLPPAGAGIDRDVSSAIDMAVSAPGDTSPRATAEIRSRRQYHITIQATSARSVTQAEVRYVDAWTTTKFGSDPVSTERSGVGNRTFVLAAGGAGIVVTPSDGYTLSAHDQSEILADVADLLQPLPAGLADELDEGDAVTLTPEEAVTFLGLGAVESGVTVRVDGLTLKLKSQSGGAAVFGVAGQFVYDGGAPHMHLESPIQGEVTVDTRWGMPTKGSVSGPLTGTLANPNGPPLTIKGTMRVDSI